ncbi:MAG: DoxX family protein [Actinomycetota bacterium]
MRRSLPAPKSTIDPFSCSFGHLENTLTDTQPHRFPPLRAEHEHDAWSRDADPGDGAEMDDDEFVFGYSSAAVRHRHNPVAPPATDDRWPDDEDDVGAYQDPYGRYDTRSIDRPAGRHDVDYHQDEPDRFTGAYRAQPYDDGYHGADRYDNDYGDHAAGAYAHHGSGPDDHGVADQGAAYYDDDGYDEYEDDYYYYDDGYDSPPSAGQPAADGLNAVVHRFDQGMTFLERLPNRWMAQYAPGVLRVGLGVCFLWFGALKLWPGLSPADALVRTTFDTMLGVVGLGSLSGLALYGLAIFEVNIGLGLLFDVYRRALVWLLIGHMFGTLIPLVLLPGEIWTTFPHALTLEGQYIVKNLVLVGGAMAVGGARRNDDDYEYEWDEHTRAEFWSERPLPTNGQAF